MEWLLNKVKDGIHWVGPTITLLIIIVIGLYIFWKEASRSRKNNSSVFDTYFLSLFGGVFFARVAHIIMFSSEYFSNIWYWLPYEKYGDQVFLFRLLPWRFMRIWDGGLDLLYLFVGMILIQTFWVTVRKKWKWNEMFPSIFLSNGAMLGLSFFFLGVQWENNVWTNLGLILLAPLLLFLILQVVVLKFQKGENKERVRLLLQLLCSIVTMLTTLYAYFTLPRPVSTLLTIAVVIWLIWAIVATIFHMLTSKKEANVTIEKVSSVRPVNIPDLVKLPRK